MISFFKFRIVRTTLACGALLFLGGIAPSSTVLAEDVSFLVDPDTIDDNMDGFITGSEFQPAGTDGTIFDLLPTDNLVGGNRFLLSETSGLHYGGGGGSTLSFDFSVNQDISLDSYTLSSSGFFLGNPSFNIMEGAVVLSSTNTSNSSGDTHAFNGGPIDLTAGTTYSFEAQVVGAGVQAFMGSWSYTPTNIPEPGSFCVLSAIGFAALSRRRR